MPTGELDNMQTLLQEKTEKALEVGASAEDVLALAHSVDQQEEIQAVLDSKQVEAESEQLTEEEEIVEGPDTASYFGELSDIDLSPIDAQGSTADMPPAEAANLIFAGLDGEDFLPEREALPSRLTEGTIGYAEEALGEYRETVPENTGIVEETAGAAVGMLETAATGVTGIAGAAVGALGGATRAVGEFVRGAVEDDYTPDYTKAYMEVFEPATQLLTYQPKTAAGKFIIGVADAPVAALIDEAQFEADRVFEETGDVAKATAIRTSAEALALLAPVLGLKGGKKAGDLLSARRKAKEARVEAASTAEAEAKLKAEEAAIKDDPVIQEVESILKKQEDTNVVKADIDTYTHTILGREEYKAFVVQKLTETDPAWQTAKGKPLSGKALEKKLAQEADWLESSFLEYNTKANVLEGYTRENIAATTYTREGILKTKEYEDTQAARTDSAVATVEGKATELGEQVWKAVEEDMARRKKTPSSQELQNSYEAELAKRKAAEEELAWLEKSDLDVEARAQDLIDRSTYHIPEEGRGRVGIRHRQAGAVDPAVFVEGMAKLGKSTKEITSALVKEFGEEWRAVAPAMISMVETGNKAGDAIPEGTTRPTKSVEELSTVDVNNFRITLPGLGMAEGAASAVLGARDLTKIWNKSEGNAPLQEALTLIEHQRSTNKGGIAPEKKAENIDTASRLFNADFLRDLETALYPIVPKVLSIGKGTMRKKLSTKVNDELVSLLNKPEIDEAGPVADAARAIRGILDGVVAIAKEHGIDAGHLEGYFPRVFLRNKIIGSVVDRAKSDKVAKLNPKWVELLSKYGLSPSQINVATSRILGTDDFLALPERDLSPRNALDAELGLLSEGEVARMKRPSGKTAFLETERTLKDIPFEELRPFLDTNVWEVLTGYSELVSPKLASAKLFGANDEKLIGLMQQAIAEGKKTGNRLTKEDVDTMFSIVDDARHEGIKIKSRAGKAIQDVLTTGVAVALLPLAALPSLLELVAPVKEFGLRRAIRSTLQSAESYVKSGMHNIHKDIKKDDLARFAEELGVSTDLMTSERLSEILDIPANKVTNTFYTITAQHAIAKFNAINTSNMYQLLTKDVYETIAGKNNRLAPRELEYAKRYLESRGVNIDQMVSWYDEGASKTDPFYTSQYKPAALNVVKDSVVLPRAAVLPKYQRVPHLRWMWQMNRFLTVYGNTVVAKHFTDLREGVRNVAKEMRTNKDPKAAMLEASILGDRAAHITATLGLGYALSHAILSISDTLKYGDEGNPNAPDPDDEPVKHNLRALEYMGLAGAASKYIGMLGATEYGTGLEAIAPITSVGWKGAEAVLALAREENSDKLADWTAKYAPGAMAMLPVAGTAPVLVNTILSAAMKNKEAREEFKEFLIEMDYGGEDLEDAVSNFKDWLEQ